jgi:hypothetical protein
MRLGVAVEVPFAGESAPTGEDREGDDLALAQGGWGSGASSLFALLILAKIVDDDVKCAEEGVLRSSMGRFLSLGDRAASRL